jgi:hypothetical protein
MARRIGDDRAPVVVPARASGYCGWSIRTTAGALHREPVAGAEHRPAAATIALDVEHDALVDSPRR